MSIILYLSLLLSSSSIHEVHLSKSELNFDTATQSIQLSIRLFLDDFELAIKNQGHSDVNLFGKREDPLSDDYIEDYLQSKLKVIVGQDTSEMAFIGREMSEDFMAIWCYLEVEHVPLGVDIQVVNSIFNEMYDDQRHVMVISKDNKRIDHWIIDEAPFTEKIRF